MTFREPECVVLKRRGAEYVEKLLAGKTQQQQLEFWKKRTEELIVKQKTIKSTSNSHSNKA